MLVLTTALRTSRARSLPTTTTPARLIHLSLPSARHARDPSASQNDHPAHPGDPHDQAARAGLAVGRGARGASLLDAAEKRESPAPAPTRGNPERVGFVDQVGGQSAAATGGAHGGGVGGREDAAPAHGGFVARVRRALGFVGVGAGADGGAGRRGVHTSARAASGGEEERLATAHASHGEQNEHLRHKAAGEPDAGTRRGGNAGATPELPSQQVSVHKGVLT
ncbi:uncharacterized protein BXZ73DRAFT_76033 [Epithele typhae]|uniref:uncharacterized protein n=1 Tax=Epithele typhae TaxID=378194 RepID=UPI002007A032|nr:uncharacterized protein BXZ73DRAFT_76033 [Epithele typhae]KAH9939319.1 hypothetical protein BXZ73DRAFT_76033 [Epithele typhae]